MRIFSEPRAYRYGAVNNKQHFTGSVHERIVVVRRYGSIPRAAGIRLESPGQQEKRSLLVMPFLVLDCMLGS